MVQISEAQRQALGVVQTRQELVANAGTGVVREKTTGLVESVWNA